MNIPTIKEQISARWRYGDNKRLAPLRATLLRALDLHQTLRDRREALAKDPKLTRIGQQDRFREQLAKEFAPELARAQRAVTHVREKLETWRTRLQPAKPGKDDTAAAIQLRSETRAIVRAMKPAERMAALLAKQPNELLIAAVLEGEKFHSGIDDETRDRVLKAAVERKFPDELKRIAETTEALELANAAVQMATYAARDAAQFPNDRVLNDFVDTAVGDSKRIGIDGELASTFGKIDTDDE